MIDTTLPFSFLLCQRYKTQLYFPKMSLFTLLLLPRTSFPLNRPPSLFSVLYLTSHGRRESTARTICGDYSVGDVRERNVFKVR